MGIALSMLFLLGASWLYPGGSQTDIHSVQFQWTENYISDLLEYKAVNGADNPARPFAVIGVIIMGLTTGLAFVRFAKKVNVRQYSIVIQTCGLLMIFFTALGTIPAFHTLAVQVGIVLNLLVFFYVTIVHLKSNRLLFKIGSILFLLSFYIAAYMFGSRTGVEYIPLVQKITHIFQIIWLLCLEYGTKREDFVSLAKS